MNRCPYVLDLIGCYSPFSPTRELLGIAFDLVVVSSKDYLTLPKVPKKRHLDVGLQQEKWCSGEVLL